MDQLEKILNDDSYIIGYCENHEQQIDQGRFEYGGCWTCHEYFRWENWPYINAKEAAESYGVCVRTVYRWIKQGKLKARLFVMGRISLNVPKRFYAILPDQARPMT